MSKVWKAQLAKREQEKKERIKFIHSFFIFFFRNFHTLVLKAIFV